MTQTKTCSNMDLVNSVPDELTKLDQWVGVRLIPRANGKGKMDKIPLNPRTGEEGKTNDPTTWGTFQQACALARSESSDGIGFVFTHDDPFVGVDLDDCRNLETGKIDSWAVAIIEQLKSYTEISLSGTGVHILVKGSLPPAGRKKGDIEMYDSGRYFVVTGRHVGLTGDLHFSLPLTIEDRSAELLALHEQVFEKAQQGPSGRDQEGESGYSGQGFAGTDDELIQQACAAKNGAQFSQL